MIRYPRRPGWNVKGRVRGAGVGWGGAGSELQAAKLGLRTPYARPQQQHLYLISRPAVLSRGEKKIKQGQTGLVSGLALGM